jgi:hypothetical protein
MPAGLGQAWGRPQSLRLLPIIASKRKTGLKIHVDATHVREAVQASRHA